MTKASEKSDGAFRTIREVADWLGVPTHVLRFWESKFAQIAPVKGAGGRRYYRPEDMRLLGGIKVMLHDQGMTIRAVSQRLEEEGPEPVMALSPPLEEAAEGPMSRPRRVIRQGDEAPPREGGVQIAKEGESPPEDLLPRQPDAPWDESDDLPDTLPSAPAPPTEPDHGPQERRPVGTRDEPLPSAPSDPAEQVVHSPEPDAAPDAGFDAAGAAPPLARLRRRVADASGVAAGDRKRLRRLVRRLRALRDEIAEDLDEDAGGDRG